MELLSNPSNLPNEDKKWWNEWIFEQFYDLDESCEEEKGGNEPTGERFGQIIESRNTIMESTKEDLNEEKEQKEEEEEEIKMLSFKQSILKLFSTFHGSNWTHSNNWENNRMMVKRWDGVMEVGKGVSCLFLPNNHMVGYLDDLDFKPFNNKSIFFLHNNPNLLPSSSQFSTLNDSELVCLSSLYCFSGGEEKWSEVEDERMRWCSSSVPPEFWNGVTILGRSVHALFLKKCGLEGDIEDILALISHLPNLKAAILTSNNLMGDLSSISVSSASSFPSSILMLDLAKNPQLKGKEIFSSKFTASYPHSLLSL